MVNLVLKEVNREISLNDSDVNNNSNVKVDDNDFCEVTLTYSIHAQQKDF